MTKRLRDYVKYSSEELEAYVQNESSCVYKVNTNMHLALTPYVLANFKYALKAHIFRKKVGYYDINLNGIVLDVKNIKLIGVVGALRADDCHIHIDINVDCYVFRPSTGSVLHGTVKHISGHENIGVVIYRVFNANVRLKTKERKTLEIDNEIKFRIISFNFNVQNIFPYIEGELLVPHKANVKKKSTSVTSVSELDEKPEINVSSSVIIKQEIPETDEEITTHKRKRRKKAI